jgi:hypothetical protein
MDKEFINIRIRRTSPEANEGNQLMRFDYAVGVFDPFVSNLGLLLAIAGAAPGACPRQKRARFPPRRPRIW